MAAATAPLNNAAPIFKRPFRKALPVESPNNRFSRAATAPPSIPMTSVMCCTKAFDPEMPVCNVARKTISARGSTTRAASAKQTSPFSSRRSQPAWDVVLVIPGSQRLLANLA